MANLDLSKYGITDVKEIVHNPSYDVLFAEETKSTLEGYEKGQVTELGAVNVMTGIYTGRSPKDKFFVYNEASKDTVWWTSDEYKNDNKPCSEEAWADLKAKAVKELSGKRLFVVDTFCGANEATRLKVRFIMEVAWQAHFVTNMFIRQLRNLPTTASPTSCPSTLPRQRWTTTRSLASTRRLLPCSTSRPRNR